MIALEGLRSLAKTYPGDIHLFKQLSLGNIRWTKIFD